MDVTETTRGLCANVIIKLPRGLHARPSARVAKVARSFDADVYIISEFGEVDAKSMLDILSLTIKHNDQVQLLARGPQARDALVQISAILSMSGE